MQDWTIDIVLNLLAYCVPYHQNKWIVFQFRVSIALHLMSKINISIIVIVTHVTVKVH